MTPDPCARMHTPLTVADGLRFCAEIVSHDDDELDGWLRTLKEIVNTNSPLRPVAADGKRGKSRSRGIIRQDT